MNFLILILILTLLGAFFGGLLGFSSLKLKPQGDPIVEKLDAVLPQSQCGQCGYVGCKPYAEALTNGEEITKCVPGGKETVEKIAEILGVDVPEVDFVASSQEEKVAFIDEKMCIGCTKCLQVCPVDAIIGTNKMLHTVVTDFCTGCKLCLSPCPTECITLIPPKKGLNQWSWQFEPRIDVKMIEEKE